ncbi:Crp/Fnr family transcriptional regulator [Neobacillus sp. D3-1R]|uniref:Crp/Fnr family transcriptional regulator n=1 Tax=Neobacillus sp. D3-1R TaxID=3445778 RepID=UPI003F9F5BC7
MRKINNSDQLESYLKAFNIDSIFNNEIKPYLSLYHFEQGELICSQGDSTEFLYVLVKGKVKIFTTSSEGKTLILSFKNPLEVIGDIEYVQGIDIINTVEAVSAGYMIGVHHDKLNSFLKDYSPFLQFLLDIITQKFYLKSNSMSFNLMYPVEVRLASYLLSINVDEDNLQLNGQISTSHLTDIANLIGTSYRHLNRVIHQFCLNGVIERKKGFLFIKDREGLKLLAGDNIYE